MQFVTMGWSNSPDRRQFLKTTGTVAVIGQVGLAGCSGSDGSSKSTGNGMTPDEEQTQTDSEAEESKQESIQLAWSHYPIIPDALPGLISIKKGFYEDHGISISEVSSFSGGGTTVRGLTTGGIPVGSGAAAAAVKGWNAGAPIQIIANDVSPPAIDVLTLPDSGIEKVQDLKGKTIAYSNPGSTSQAMLILSLERADGISVDDVELKALGGLGESITAVKEGAVDAGWSNIIVSIPKINNGEFKRVYGTWEHAKEIPSEVIMTGTRTIENKPDLLKNIIASHQKSNEFIKKNTGETAKIWADTADNIMKDLGKQVLDTTLEINEDYYSVEFPDNAFSSLSEMLKLADMVDESPNWDKIVDKQFLP